MKLFLAMMVCIAVGLAGGYGVGYVIYTNQILDYQRQLSDMTSKTSRLNQTLVDKEAQVAYLEKDKSFLNSEVIKFSSASAAMSRQISNLETQKAELQSSLATTQATLTYTKAELSTSKAQVTELQRKYGTLIEIRVPQHYEWFYQKDWQWDLLIPLSDYLNYLDRARPSTGAAYVNLVRESQDDSYLTQLVEKLKDVATKAGLSDFQKLMFAITFMQSLPYTNDDVTTPYDEYPRYPIETLFDRGGDCEDTSILAAAILDRMGYDVALLLLPNAKHMALGIAYPSNLNGTYYQYGSTKYYYLETTGDGWLIGQFPRDLKDSMATVHPVRS